MFHDEVFHVKEIEDKVSMEECRTLILSSKLNNELISYCNSICMSNHAKSFILMPKKELYIKVQWVKQFGVDAHEKQGDWEKGRANNNYCKDNSSFLIYF